MTTQDFGGRQVDAPAFHLTPKAIEYGFAKSHFGDDRDITSPMSMTTLTFSFTAGVEGYEEICIKAISDLIDPLVMKLKSVEIISTSVTRFARGKLRKSLHSQTLIVKVITDHRIADEAVKQDLLNWKERNK